MMSKIGKGQQLRLRLPIVTRDKMMLSLLKNESFTFCVTILFANFLKSSVTADVENNALIINGTTVHLITANSPERIDYT
jgi:glyceraldehyde 3-phosphate dehydrogenase